jgi:hypothetical protein
MGVTVVTTTTASSAEFVRLRAAVAVADSPQVGASYQLPAAQIAYIDLSLSVVLDTQGLFKLLRDSAAVADVLALTAQKLLTESLQATDAPILEARKQLTESVGTTDELTRTLVFLRNFADGASVADASSIAFTLATRQEFLSALSQDVRDVSKLIADGFAMNDGTDVGDGSTYSFSKGISNVAFAGDASVRTAAKGLSDSTALSDVVTRNAAKGLSDTATAQEVLNRAVTKLLADSSSAVDSLAVSFSRPLADASSVIDNDFWTFSASRVESISVPDSGFLRSQNYCDLSYFAEDYVGVSQSF